MQNQAAANDSDDDNRYGGCFGGECKVLMRDGSRKLVKDIVKGDQVATRDGGAVSYATI